MLLIIKIILTSLCSENQVMEKHFLMYLFPFDWWWSRLAGIFRGMLLFKVAVLLLSWGCGSL